MMEQNRRTVPIPQQAVVSILRNWDFIVTKNYRYAFNVLKTVNQIEAASPVFNYKFNVQIKIMSYIFSELVQRRKKATVLHLVEKSVAIKQQYSKGCLILLLALQKKLLSRISSAFYRIVEKTIFRQTQSRTNQQGDMERHFLVAIYQSSQKIRLIFDLLVRKQYFFAFQKLKKVNKLKSQKEESNVASIIDEQIRMRVFLLSLNPIQRISNLAFQNIKIVSSEISIRNQEEIQIQAYKSIISGLNKQTTENCQIEIDSCMIQQLQSVVHSIQMRLVRQCFDCLYYYFDKDCTQDTIQVLKQEIEYLQQEVQ